MSNAAEKLSDLNEAVDQAPAERFKLMQFWDAAVPEQVQPLLDSVRDKNPDFDYELFNDDSGSEYIEKHFGAEIRDVFLGSSLPAMRSDIFRYCYLYIDGGFYVDADVLARQDLSGMVPHCEAGALFMRDDGLTNSFFFIRERKNPLMLKILEDSVVNYHARTVNNVWVVTGPAVMRKIYGDPDQAHLFDGIHMLGDEELFSYIHMQPQLDYKKTDVHWHTARKKGISIYR